MICPVCSKDTLIKKTVTMTVSEPKGIWLMLRCDNRFCKYENNKLTIIRGKNTTISERKLEEVDLK